MPFCSHHCCFLLQHPILLSNFFAQVGLDCVPMRRSRAEDARDGVPVQMWQLLWFAQTEALMRGKTLEEAKAELAAERKCGAEIATVRMRSFATRLIPSPA